MSEYDTLDAPLIAWLKTETGRPIGLVEPPVATPQMPYAVVTPWHSPPPQGDMGSRTSNQDVRYSIRCVGEDPRSIRWMQAKVKTAMMAFEIEVVQWVLSDGEGAIVRDGETLYTSITNYTVRI